MKFFKCGCVALLLGCFAQANDDLISHAQALQAGQISPVQLLQRYQAQIERYNPSLRAVQSMNPQAMQQTQGLLKNEALPLWGLPILVKDNIDVAGMVTTAGSIAMADNLREQDAPVVASLRQAGAIIVGKASLSEWANLRSSKSTSGWSSAGGQVRNPYDLQRSPCGSSSGSGAAVAARLIPAAIGSETDGSIVCPASVNGIVGLKPTLGLLSQVGIVPISHHQDSAGPMTLTVKDAALLLNVMVDRKGQSAPDYLADLNPQALRGKRLGVVRALSEGYDASTKRLFAQTLRRLRSLGAVIVDDVVIPKVNDLGEDELAVLLTDFKVDLNAYLASTPAAVKVRSLADVIAFNQAHAATVMPYFGQEYLEQAEQTKGTQDPAYQAALARLQQAAGPEGIDAALKKYKLDALIAPTTGRAWRINYPKGDLVEGSASSPAAVAGYPHITVPMGLAKGLPVGLSIFAQAYSEAKLLAYAYAFEQARGPLPAPKLRAVGF